MPTLHVREIVAWCDLAVEAEVLALDQQSFPADELRAVPYRIVLSDSIVARLRAQAC